MLSGRRVCRVATESGDFPEEAVHSSAAPATVAEGAERDAAVRQSEYPAIPATFRGGMPQERQSALNLEEVDVLVSLERKREEGLPRKRQDDRAFQAAAARVSENTGLGG